MSAHGLAGFRAWRALAAAILVPGMPLHGDGQPTLANGRVLTQTSITTLRVLTPDSCAASGLPPMAKT